MKSLRLSALAAALALAACSFPAPTDPAVAGAPSFDEGPGMVGSGNKDGGNTIGSGNTNDSPPSDSTAPGTERGGGSLGSGN